MSRISSDQDVFIQMQAVRDSFGKIGRSFEVSLDSRLLIHGLFEYNQAPIKELAQRIERWEPTEAAFQKFKREWDFVYPKTAHVRSMDDEEFRGFLLSLARMSQLIEPLRILRGSR